MSRKNVSRNCLPYLHISYAKQFFEANPEFTSEAQWLGSTKKDSLLNRSGTKVTLLDRILMKANNNCDQETRYGGYNTLVKIKCLHVDFTALVSVIVRVLSLGMKDTF